MTGISRQRHIGFGYTEEGYRVVASVDLRTDDRPREVTFIDHSTGPAPETLGIMFEVFDPQKGRDRGAVSAGQTPPEDRVIVRRAASDATPEVREVIEQAWERWNLNTMHAECVHMTEEALNPSDDVLDAYRAAKTAERGEWREKYSPAFFGRADVLQSWRLDNVTCPETGYRYGRAWLAEALPADVLAAMRSIIETGKLIGEDA